MNLFLDLESHGRMRLFEVDLNVDALTMLLIAMAPNLASLRMEEAFTADNYILEQYSQQVLYNSGSAWAGLNQFRNLREASMPGKRG